MARSLEHSDWPKGMLGEPHNNSGLKTEHWCVLCKPTQVLLLLCAVTKKP